MALIILGSGVAQASGRLGGSVFSHNRYGVYLRNGTIPVNPNTTRQSDLRSIFASCVERWNNTLTDAQRAQWGVYGAAIPRTNRLGQTVYLPGMAHYVRSNVSRIQAGLSAVDAGPATLTLPGEDSTFTPSISAATQNFSIIFNNTLDWAAEVGGALLVYGGMPQASNINFFGGPHRYAGKVAGATPTPPTSPATVASPFTIQEDQKVWVYGRILRADGRLSDKFLASCVCAA